MKTNSTDKTEFDADVLLAGADELGIKLSLAQVSQFRQYYVLMADWNRRVNLTAVTEWEAVQSRHFVDSLSVVLALPDDALANGRFADVGAGAGFPGAPLKIAFPGLRATLMEATAKKAAFLNELTGVLKLSDVEILIDRSETLAHREGLRESFDFVLCRAIAKMRTLAELTLPLCRIGGVVVAQKSIGVNDELDAARNAIEKLGGELKEVQEISTKTLGEGRALVVLQKVRSTPDNYPRRPGIPKKRPL